MTNGHILLLSAFSDKEHMVDICKKMIRDFMSQSAKMSDAFVRDWIEEEAQLLE